MHGAPSTRIAGTRSSHVCRWSRTAERFEPDLFLVGMDHEVAPDSDPDPNSYCPGACSECGHSCSELRAQLSVAELLLADKQQQIDAMNAYEEHLEDQLQALVAEGGDVVRVQSKITRAQRLAFALVGVLMEEPPAEAPEPVQKEGTGKN